MESESSRLREMNEFSADGGYRKSEPLLRRADNDSPITTLTITVSPTQSASVATAYEKPTMIQSVNERKVPCNEEKPHVGTAR